MFLVILDSSGTEKGVSEALLALSRKSNYNFLSPCRYNVLIQLEEGHINLVNSVISGLSKSSDPVCCSRAMSILVDVSDERKSIVTIVGVCIFEACKQYCFIIALKRQPKTSYGCWKARMEIFV
jgi:hypothetical protein